MKRDPAVASDEAIPQRRVAVTLAAGMSLSSALLAIEPLRAVNRFLQQPAYAIGFVGADLQPVTSGVGIAVTPEASFADSAAWDIAIVVSATDQPEPYRRALARWLRLQGQKGAMLCGVDYGAVLLAEAGLLDGRRATTHWEVRTAISARFPSVTFCDEIFVIDGPRATCGGHLSCHDLFLALVERDHGPVVARFVAADLVSAPGRSGVTRQGDPLVDARPIADARLRKVAEVMERTIEAPVGLRVLAQAAGLSVRQLQTLAWRHFDETISARYLGIRLSAARHMLMYGEAPITEIALSAGFASASVFCRAFRRRFRTTPTSYRAAFRKSRVRPYFFGEGEARNAIWQDT